jgi:glycosyltransferase involved in cell wall biosynthesis
VTRRVAFVGPLPPPLHGFSSINAAMLAALKERAAVTVFDRAKRSNARGRQTLQQIIQTVKYTFACRQDAALYLALSGGIGQIVDLLYVLTSKIFRQRAFVHHHSFAYINSSSAINKILFSLLRKQTHIVLSRGMAVALAKRYNLDEQRIIVVSNAAYFAGVSNYPRPSPIEETAVRLGFISNITFDKGFVEFFEVLRQLKQLGIEYRACIAGPLAPETRQIFAELCAALPAVEYIGAIYGEAKESFYRQIDVLLFPTKYANEAEPLVIHEALRNGVYVIACDRGAIAEMLGNGAGLAFKLESYVNSAAICISDLNADRAKLKRVQRFAFDQEQRLRAVAGVELARVLNEIVGAKGLSGASTVR